MHLWLVATISDSGLFPRLAARAAIVISAPFSGEPRAQSRVRFPWCLEQRSRFVPGARNWPSSNWTARQAGRRAPGPVGRKVAESSSY